MHNHKISILYNPKIDDEERKIFEDVFGKDEVIFGEYKTKGMLGGAIDIQIIIDTLNNPTITALLTGAGFIKLIATLVKKLFNRNTKKIMDNNSRPRYTNLTLRMETSWIVISNVNNHNKIFISKVSADFDEIKKQIEKGEDEYSDEKLKEYLEVKI